MVAAGNAGLAGGNAGLAAALRAGPVDAEDARTLGISRDDSGLRFKDSDSRHGVEDGTVPGLADCRSSDYQACHQADAGSW